MTNIHFILPIKSKHISFYYVTLTMLLNRNSYPARDKIMTRCITPDNGHCPSFMYISDGRYSLLHIL